MEELDKILELIEEIKSDTEKVYRKGNYEASKRARKNAQKLKEIIPDFRKEILREIKDFKDKTC